MVSEKRARELAEKELRFEVGSLPFLSDPEYDDSENAYVFTIKFTKTDLPEFEEVPAEETGTGFAEKRPKGDVEFYESREIGELRVYEDGTITRTSNDVLNEAIEDLNEKAESGELPKRSE